MGDRFGRQAQSQLQAIIQAQAAGISVSPVWNKSNREHNLIGTEPPSVKQAAQQAVTALGWQGPWHIDADHIGLATVDRFLDSSDFFTIDVADFALQPAPAEAVETFLKFARPLLTTLTIPGLLQPLEITAAMARQAAGKYLLAMTEAGKIYRHILHHRPDADFITEVSVDETDLPQTPADLLLILAMLAAEGIPAQTIAPKFTGRFNKGVDYVGDLRQFETEFAADLCVLKFAIAQFGLPASLKLSVHSGSDKFSLYPIIARQIRLHDAGLHVKTAGTNWLEELIGLAESGADGLALAKEIYGLALPRLDELVQPYATVVDIDRDKLPTAAEMAAWTAENFASALRHDQSNPAYNLHFRQFLHVAFKIAGEMKDRYLQALDAHAERISHNVTQNLLQKHLLPLFGPLI